MPNPDHPKKDPSRTADIEWRDLWFRNPSKFTSELVEATSGCAIWQCLSEFLQENGFNLHEAPHASLTGVASASPALIRGLVNYCLDSRELTNGEKLTEASIDSLCSFIAYSVSNAAWQPAYDLSVDSTEVGPLHFFYTGAMSALSYIMTLFLVRAVMSARSKERRDRYFCSTRLQKNIVQTLFQVLPVASYFVQTNGRYLIDALKSTNSKWLDAARAAACGAIGYMAGYFIRALVGFLSYGFQHALKYFSGYGYGVYKCLIDSSSSPEARGYEPILAHDPDSLV